LKGIPDWQKTTLLVPHPRIATAATAWGWPRVIVASLDGASLTGALQDLKALL
ncbi:MAG: hypothetical protein JNM52_06610, partial [Betaproteobacteria bacterium]|nr:hypothetical protein [Betaproteobacteria bacterium]